MEMLCPTSNELKLKIDKNSRRKTAEAADEALASLNMVNHKDTLHFIDNPFPSDYKRLTCRVSSYKAEWYHIFILFNLTYYNERRVQ
jgi:hypothetical protein